MEAEQPKGMQTKWIFTLFSIGSIIVILDNLVGDNCFSKKEISDDARSWSIFIGIMLVCIFFNVLERFNFMVINNAFNDKNVAKKLTSFTVFSYMLCIFMFGSMFVRGVINFGLDLAILSSANVPGEFRVKVFDVDTAPGGGRGGCHGIKYTFYNPPVNRDTTICGTQALAFLKTGDVLRVHETVGAIGVHFISEEYASS